MTYLKKLTCLGLAVAFQCEALDFMYADNRTAEYTPSGLVTLTHTNVLRTFDIICSGGEGYIRHPDGQSKYCSHAGNPIPGNYIRSFNPSVPFKFKAGQELAFAIGSLRFEVSGQPATDVMWHESIYRFGCREGMGDCTFRVRENGTDIGTMAVSAGESWDIRFGNDSLADVTAPIKETEKHLLEIYDAKMRKVWWNDVGYKNKEDWSFGLKVRVKDELVSNETNGAFRSWGTELYMDTLIFKKGETGSTLGPAPHVMVTAKYPDGDVSLNSGGSWTPEVAVREWKNDDGSGWLGLRARTTLSKPGEYLGTMVLTLSTL